LFSENTLGKYNGLVIFIFALVVSIYCRESLTPYEYRRSTFIYTLENSIKIIEAIFFSKIKKDSTQKKNVSKYE